MKLRIFHSVNSGLFFWDGAYGLLVDGIHSGTEQGFSAMPAGLRQQMLHGSGLFANTNSILFTHLHKDHFDAAGLHSFLQVSHPKVYGPALPESSVSAYPVRSGMDLLDLDGCMVFALHSVHDGSMYRDVPHCSYLVHMGGESIFIAGDAAFPIGHALASFEFFGTPLSAVFLNPYQLISAAGQAFLSDAKPDRLFMYHLPFPEDDRTLCYGLARQAIRHMPPMLPKIELIPPMSWIDEAAVGTSLCNNEGAFVL